MFSCQRKYVNHTNTHPHSHPKTHTHTKRQNHHNHHNYHYSRNHHSHYNIIMVVIFVEDERYLSRFSRLYPVRIRFDKNTDKIQEGSDITVYTAKGYRHTHPDLSSNGKCQILTEN